MAEYKFRRASKKLNYFMKSKTKILSEREFQRDQLNRFQQKLFMVLELGKLKITFFVALSTIFGYILYSPILSVNMLIVPIGVLFVAMGSAALNHLQEREFDKLMERTKRRPIPSGQISAGGTFFVALIFVSLGLILLSYSSNISAIVLTIITLVWYNLVYTPLKRVVAIAVVPGALIGALPPVIGWVAAGGSIFDLPILVVAMFLFMWQIPHFWLLALMFNDDYETAGYPTLKKVFNDFQIRRITFIWITAVTVFSLLIPFYTIQSGIIMAGLLTANSIYLIYNSFKLLTEKTDRNIYRSLFMKLNMYVLAAVLIISLDRIIQ